jgi:hypothetical protein
MNFAAIFLLFAVAMIVGWRRDGALVYWLFLLGMLLTVALYLHHATSVLPLSF